MDRNEIEYLIEQKIVGYPNCGRDREIMRLRLLDGIPFERLAEQVGMSPRRVKQIVKDCTQKLH